MVYKIFCRGPPAAPTPSGVLPPMQPQIYIIFFKCYINLLVSDGGGTGGIQADDFKVGGRSFPNKRILETIHEIPACDIILKNIIAINEKNSF